MDLVGIKAKLLELLEIVKSMETKPNYLWDNPVNARHSIRVMCDEAGLSISDKNTLCAVIGAESGWMNFREDGSPVTNKNLRSDGSLSSTDWGICQINDKYHIGTNNTFPSVDYVMQNPEKVVAWMIKMYKKGHINWWCAFVNGSYKKNL